MNNKTVARLDLFDEFNRPVGVGLTRLRDGVFLSLGFAKADGDVQQKGNVFIAEPPLKVLAQLRKAIDQLETTIKNQSP